MLNKLSISDVPIIYITFLIYLYMGTRILIIELNVKIIINQITI